MEIVGSIIHEVDACTAAALIVRASAIDEVGC